MHTDFQYTKRAGQLYQLSLRVPESISLRLSYLSVCPVYLNLQRDNSPGGQNALSLVHQRNNGPDGYSGYPIQAVDGFSLTNFSPNFLAHLAYIPGIFRSQSARFCSVAKVIKPTAKSQRLGKAKKLILEGEKKVACSKIKLAHSLSLSFSLMPIHHEHPV